MRKAKDQIEAILGPQTSFKGKLAVQGTVQIEGRFEGQISSSGCTMRVGEEATVYADIAVNTVMVEGELNGNIQAADRIHLSPTARVFGDLRAPNLITEAGVFLEGHCTVRGKEPAKNDTASSEPEDTVKCQ